MAAFFSIAKAPWLLLNQLLARSEPSEQLASPLSCKDLMNFVTLERIASLMAAAGSMWFVNEITRGFLRLYLILPPTGGPTEVIGLAVLIWLYAKHQRFLHSEPKPEFMAKLESR